MNVVATTPAYSPLTGFTNVLRSEFCKLGSVRSTYWTLFAAVAFNVVLAGLEAIILPGHLSAHDKATLDATRVSLGGIHLSQIAFGVLGVLVITSEYGTGMIRATLSAVPQRRLVLAAKALVFTVVGLVIGVVASFAAFFVFQAFLPGDSLRSSIGDPGVLRAVIGGGLYLTVLGLLGLGLGAIIRVSAGAIAVLVGALFVPQILVHLLPQSWQAVIGPYVPMEAGNQIFSARQEAGNLGAWAGFGVFSVYAVVALAVGFLVISRRDA
ncbi:MAG: ABC transporter permease subunit [Candidatus Dormibacteraeota bacterium]|uniref:ABC transporter permease subunit n=1 Tax=Candidatus Amunia macphersoniae TaxID=3127014 RepID=A0A934KEA0_9BACT|nr:ABC transporter permease subunit [Candidatus Dormibacteraeota bacterium]